MSPADATTRIARAAITLGAADGVSAMSLQGIATAAGVSKALLLYHYAGKAALLATVVDLLGETSAARLRQAAAAPDALGAWRLMAHDRAALGELALLSALTLERDVAPEAVQARRAATEAAAATLATAILAGVQLAPRVPAPFLGRLLLRQLDGLAAASARVALPTEALEAELDTFALALLALGR